MILITLFLYIHENQESNYYNYEEAVLPILEKHGGQMMTKIGKGNLVWNSDNLNCPDEIHVVSFPSKIAYKEYIVDPERIALSDLRKSAIKETMVMQEVQ